MSFAVISVESLEDHIRGYLGRFLPEITTGLYVGSVSKKVADGLWTTVASSTTARAVMVTPAQGEPGFQVSLHNVTNMEFRDFDGLYLPVRLPSLSK
jgi:CRISPR-associated protein Cas2